jgi:hypothetical protein
MAKFETNQPAYQKYQKFTTLKVILAFLICLVLPIILLISLGIWFEAIPLFAKWLIVVSAFGGCIFAYAVFYEQHSYNFVGSQRHINNQLPENQSLFFRLDIPENMNYKISTMYYFFLDFFDSFTSMNKAIVSLYKFGKTTPKLKFSFIAEKGKLVTYISFPIKKLTDVRKMFSSYFPQIGLSMVQNPFIGMPYSWDSSSSYGEYDDLVGCYLHSRLTSFLPLTMKADDQNYNASQHGPNPNNINNGQFNLFINCLKSRLSNQKVVVQVIFGGRKFNDLDDSKTAAKKTELTDAIVKNIKGDSFNTLDKIKKNNSNTGRNSNITTEDLDLLKVFTSKGLKDYNDRINDGGVRRIASSWKIMILCKKKDRKFTEDVLERTMRAYYGNNDKYTNFLEIKYPSATFQKYYRWTEENAEILYLNTFLVFPWIWLQLFVYQWYDKFYFPKENTWRKSQVYTSVVSQSSYKGIGTGQFPIDIVDAGNLFQIPTSVNINFDEI